MIGWMLGLPVATSEGATDVVTNVRPVNQFTENGKTSVIDVRHFEGFFSEVSWIQVGKGTWSIEILKPSSNTFYICHW